MPAKRNEMEENNVGLVSLLSMTVSAELFQKYLERRFFSPMLSFISSQGVTKTKKKVEVDW